MRRARDSADHFVDRERQFHLRVLPTERPHPCTRTFSRTVQRDPREAVAMLLSVDRDFPQVARRVVLFGTLR